MSKLNLVRYAETVSKNIKSQGRTDLYHWSELSTLIDELLKYVGSSEKTKGQSDVINNQS